MKIKLLITALILSFTAVSQDLLFRSEDYLKKRYPNTIFVQDYTDDKVRYLYSTIDGVLYCLYMNNEKDIYRYLMVPNEESITFDMLKYYESMYTKITISPEMGTPDESTLFKMWKAPIRDGINVRIRLFYDIDDKKYVYVFDEWDQIQK